MDSSKKSLPPKTASAAVSAPAQTEPAEPALPGCDILIFTAVPEEEKALKRAAKESGLPYEKVALHNFEYRNLRMVGSNRVMAIETEMGPFGFDGSAARAIYAQIQTRATTLVSLGMAFGIDRERQRVGDVLVSTSVLTYDDRKVKRDDKGAIVTCYPDKIRYRARDQILNPLRQEAGRRDWKGVQFGSLLSGGCLIHCADYRDELVRNLTPELQRLSTIPDERIIGGEMEVCGILATSDREAPNWVVVKGISDYADEKRDDEIKQTRPIACERAARFLLDALLNFQPEAV